MSGLPKSVSICLKMLIQGRSSIVCCNPLIRSRPRLRMHSEGRADKICCILSVSMFFLWCCLPDFTHLMSLVTVFGKKTSVWLKLHRCALMFSSLFLPSRIEVSHRFMTKVEQHQQGLI
eukprot:Blabericola_migrator_1__2378@NODE_1668_length_4046_cov_38_827846_g347_i1_p4_GENE_NODE_1668_length_4046_cov_38_827846_g347_i1NODE_1668_length_4046_cov_38_827846_g347_i1_p4_ORF_typecomplete_len119_score7_08CSG2/PF16965_5/0_019Orai1/PF07856_12/2_3e02Orai1/PF07856_12/0_14_NODE_1668_length_4046_cov_38_827846_g347_i115251881